MCSIALRRSRIINACLEAASFIVSTFWLVVKIGETRALNW
jgi:hypothetical protein